MKRTPFTYGADDAGRKYWRSLDELADSPEFKEALANEFPEGAIELTDPVSRRSFMSLMGASLALAGVTGCRRPEEKILPYSKAPEHVVPGKASFYATAMEFGGSALGLLVESHEGRPTKIEGNPNHPDSLGASNAWAQAAVLDLYDPDRSTSPRQNGQTRSWSDAKDFLTERGNSLASRQGKGLAILTEAHRSPTTAALLDEVRTRFPEARIHRWSPLSRTNVREGARLAFGRPLEPVIDLRDAKVVLTLDADIFGTEGTPVRSARQFADGRRLDAIDRPVDVARPTDVMNRLYAVESSFTVTGTAADHRLRLQSRNVGAYLAALTRELVAAHGLQIDPEVARQVHLARPEAFEQNGKWIKAVAKDLAAHRGKSVLVAGERQPAAVHALVALVNKALGNDTTVTWVAPFDASEDGPKSLVELTAAIRRNEVDTLVILGGNPVFDAPADVGFADALAKVPNSVHLATHVDETSTAAGWHLNRAHFLEGWSDVRALDGTASVVQPLIAPLHGGKTDAEVLSVLLGRARKAHDLVQATWKSAAAVGFEPTWRKALHDGVFANTAYTAEAVEPQAAEAAKALTGIATVTDDGFEVTFAPDFHAWDGRFANNGWLQELPEPMTKLTWDNAALVSPATARKLGVKAPKLGDYSVNFVTVEVPGAGTVKLPALVAPGQADDSIALTVGQGRSKTGKVGTGVGVSTYALRTGAGFGFVSGAKVSAAGGSYLLAITQEHHSLEGRSHVREATLSEAAETPNFPAKEDFLTANLKKDGKPLSVFAAHSYEGHKWGMSIDLNTCIGCNACMIACQAENNIPLVGKKGVLNNREMHWIRIDRYFSETADEPKAVLQPVTCAHCENAPCETVCPVAATTHSPEGLNDMAYNRCVGTRYCANNCPYKVRRFNFFNYTYDMPELQKMQQNPNVTVRMRGVVEKCTFCVQRINEAKIAAKREDRTRLRDGEVKTACQQSCPTQAIVFGDLNDPSSEVAKRSAKPRGYKLLEELNIRPRTTYLARVRNPNTELESA